MRVNKITLLTRITLLLPLLVNLLVCGSAWASQGENESTVTGHRGKPAVLFATGGVHSKYVVNPLKAMGIEVDVCDQKALPDRLATGKYNVVVVGTCNEDTRKTLTDFIAHGGGVFVCNPEDSFSNKDWTGTNQWLAGLGASPRWEVLKDSDPANLYRDDMNCQLSWSTDIASPVKDGVTGVLTLTWDSTGGCEPPMSFDLSPDWNVVVRGAPTLHTVPEKRNDVVLQPWIEKTPIAGSPALLALRQSGPGRVAVLAIRTSWLFTPPASCPTAQAMLTAGAGGKPSDWLRVFANTFRWLAEPSLAAGQGGATTPDTLLNPPVTPWQIPAQIDWSTTPALKDTPDQPQVRGLIGARTSLSSGHGTVADYVKAAKDAGLQYIVFLEDSLVMDQSKWDQLVAQCTAHTDDAFKAIPGLTYEDAQGDHLYVFSDEVKFPKPEMLLPDHRLATTQSMRSRTYFDYINEYIAQNAITGFWNHRANMLIPADYKLYNSFPIFSFIDGKPVDDALPDFLYLQGNGDCQAPLAFEIMTSPDQVAKRAARGWKVVRISGPLKPGPVTEWYRDAFSFSGSGAQYITNGPQILVWQCPNVLTFTNGLWWRPDLWEYRVRLRVASDAGLKNVTLYDGDRQVLRRWNPNGAKSFEQELVMANGQEIAPSLVVEDMDGHRAISSAFWSRNLNADEFICTDRCNFLGSDRLRTRAGGQFWTPVGFQQNMGITPSKGLLALYDSPALSLTPNSPTLPIDGAPGGYPTCSLDFTPRIPGELPHLFAYPQTYLVSPEIGIGQADIKLAYDPTDGGDTCKTTSLGHPYTGRQDGYGNSWASWHRFVPTQKVEGWVRQYATTWLTEGFRLGAFEASLKVKSDLAVPDDGLYVTNFGDKVELWQNGQKIGDATTVKTTGNFDRGTFATLQDKGGAVVLIGNGDHVVYHFDHGKLALSYKPGSSALSAGTKIHYQVYFAGASGETKTDDMVQFARQFGVMTPGTPGYKPEMVHGQSLDTYFFWSSDAAGTSVQARLAKTPMPGFLTARVQGLNDNWSVFLLDKGRPAPNFRALPIRDGISWAQLDLVDHDSDLFIGHPITADNSDVKLLVNWKQDGQWYVEASNPTAAPITASLKTTPGWPLFAFAKTVTLAPGSSQNWEVDQAP